MYNLFSITGRSLCEIIFSQVDVLAGNKDTDSEAVNTAGSGSAVQSAQPQCQNASRTEIMSRRVRIVMPVKDEETIDETDCGQEELLR